MKKNNITQLIILLLPNILWFTSCYEDKSSFVTNLSLIHISEPTRH